MNLALFTKRPVKESSAPSSVPNFVKMQERAKSSIEAEVKRIAALPVTTPLSQDDIDLVSRHYLSPKAYADGGRLHSEQALAMVQYNDYGGIFVTLGVGRGKTLISFMVANDCYKKIILARQGGDHSKEPRILLVVQANLLEKFENDVPKMRSFLKEMPPYHIMRGADKRKRALISQARRRGLYVCSYHTLQTKDATDILEAIRPALIICDEAQNVAGNRDSARAKRFRNFVSEYQPEVVPLSGTMTRKSVMDYWFLSKAALGQNNFLPNSKHMAEEWAMALDSSAPNMSGFRNDLRPRPGPISYITSWCHKYFPEIELPPNLIGFRRGYAKRMVTAPGVICSAQDDPVKSSLVFSNNICKGKEDRPGWARLQEHLEILMEDFQTPSGEELACAMNVWMYRYEMEATGFYYDLYWREPEELARIRKISVSEAESILDRSKQHHEDHKQYQAALRHWIKNNSRTHLDTPALIGTNMKHHGSDNVGAVLYNKWITWKESVFVEMDVRQRRPVRVCDFKVRAMAQDVYDNRKHGNIAWYTNQEMGDWAMDELRAKGLDPIHCPRGDWSNKFLNDPDKYKGKDIVAAIGPHSEGKDLQFGLYRNYYLQVPISALKMEQNLGRTHRQGQLQDEVDAQFYLCSDFDHAHFNMILNDTAYMQQTTTQRQKLLLGSYNFKPKSIPYTAMQEMGANVIKLDVDGRKILDGIIT